MAYCPICNLMGVSEEHAFDYHGVQRYRTGTSTSPNTNPEYEPGPQPPLVRCTCYDNTTVFKPCPFHGYRITSNVSPDHRMKADVHPNCTCPSITQGQSYTISCPIHDLGIMFNYSFEPVCADSPAIKKGFHKI